MSGAGQISLEASHRELRRLTGSIDTHSAGVIAAKDGITDEDDLKMVGYISVSIASLRDLTGTGAPADLLSRPHRHAIRNCLNAIKGGAQLLIEGAPDNGLDPEGSAIVSAEAMVADSDAILACLDAVKIGSE
ncbi:hypothetical protein N825_15850 [Skermanella stibiiresistens SB22]|uniref:Uncharacterized protein n=1 Tax=Skermanella stibiiresistens SB22 TaxID=1385369 RepID=W9GVP3_9PROT|nr:hypothetical protein [Skermanella stibiiresistens]EWY37874.1 hypothetical protein N825_15850 [Skermanella stibiiresistens SB22]